MDGYDEISRPFHFELMVSCKGTEMKAAVLGTERGVEVTGGEPRYFHGLVTRFGLRKSVMTMPFTG